MADSFVDINDQHFTDFLAWAAQNGAKFPKLRFVNFPKEGRGGLTIEDIEPEEELCSVPTSMLLTEKAIRNTEFGKTVAAVVDEIVSSIEDTAGPKLDKVSIGVDEWDKKGALWYLFFVHEHSICFESNMSNKTSKLKPSFWSPYFQILPNHISTPLGWNQKQLEELTGTNLLEATLQLRTKLQTMYNLLFPKLFLRFPDIFHSDIFTFDSFIWAFQAFWSRALGIILDGQQSVPAMVPLVDMLNHCSSVKDTYFTDVLTNRFCLKTNQKVMKGTQAFNNFGPRANEKLLLNYGFVIRDNFADSFTLRLANQPTDPLYEERQQRMKKFKLESVHFLVKGMVDVTPIQPTLLQALRIGVMDDIEAYLTKASNANFETPISSGNELLMFSTLRRFLEQKQSQFLTTIQQDEEILSKPIPYELECAVTTRLCQKEILVKAINYADELQHQYWKQLTSDFQHLNHIRSVPHSNVPSALSSYFTWLQNNSQVGAVAISKLSDESIGFTSTKEITAGDVLFTFPLKLVITIQTVLDSEFGQQLQPLFAQHKVNEEGVLILFLIHELTDIKSVWKPFLDAADIPEDWPFSEHLGESLEGTPVITEFEQMNQEYQEDCTQLFTVLSQAKSTRHLFNPQSHTMDNYIKAKLILETRSVKNLRINGVIYQHAILPLAVIPKSHPNAMISRTFDPITQSIVLTSQCRYLPQYAICDNSSGMRNSQLLLERGEAIANNPSDYFMLAVDPEASEFGPVKEAVLKQCGVEFNHYLQKDCVPSQLLAVFRVLMATEHDLVPLVHKNNLTLQSLSFLSAENEAATMETLLGVIEGMLNGFEGSEVEEVKLQSGKVSHVERSAILYKKGQKEILESVLQKLQKMVPEVDMEQ